MSDFGSVEFDNYVLCALSGERECWTYVIRNILVMEFNHAKDLKTSRVLRACRRLQEAGFLKEAPTSSGTHKNWKLTSHGALAAECIKQNSAPSLPTCQGDD